jgi:phosphoribosylformylglycinamidine synthase
MPATPAPVHTLVVSPRDPAANPRAAGLLADAHALGLSGVVGLECHDLYFLEGALTESDRARLATELLVDPVTQTFAWRDGAGPGRASSPAVLEVALRPGVTDPVAAEIVRCANELGIAGLERAATGQRYVVHLQSTRPAAGAAGAPTSGDPASLLHALARRSLANPVIQRYAIGEIAPTFPHPAEASGAVESIPLRDLLPAELIALSRDRRAALDLAEMQAIQAYFRAENREPTDVEFEMLAQTWSEHCVHKTFKARIRAKPAPPSPAAPGAGTTTAHERAGSGAQPEVEIDGLLRTYVRAATERIAAPWVRSAFVDNAGVIEFDDAHDVSFKVETHNHPSAIEPFGGANTGVGGVVRDVLGVSARPIAATDVLCFGPPSTPIEALPDGVLHPRRIRSGVVAGVQDYGNKLGIPTVSGAIWYDPAYVACPLVYCGCVGLAPRGSHPRDPAPGDRVIVLGGGTGRDGLRGATFSSMPADAQTSEVSGASVQIGDPITEKGLIEVILRARDQRLYTAITDCGAGGLSSAVGEMAGALGADVDLRQVRLKYAGLAPWEIWLSEAQERMVLAVPARNLPALGALCDLFDTGLTDLGAFTGTGRIVVRHAGRIVLDLDGRFLREGLPQRALEAGRAPAAELPGASPPVAPPSTRPADLLLALLSHPNIASKADVIRVYDHEVQGGTVGKPLTGARDDGPSDACVLKPLGTTGTRGLVLSAGFNPEFGKADPYRMAASVVDEAVRNAVAVGADPDRIALLDNFCWGDPLRPEVLTSLVEAARGCHDASLHHRAPFISGKDSLNNEYLGVDGARHAIPPSLLISAIGIIHDVRRAVTMDLKALGDRLYLLGETRPEFGGSHLALVARPPSPAASPVPEPSAEAPALYRALHAAMRAGLVSACHDLSEGGLAVAAAEMCIGGRLGLALRLPGEATTALFSESNGRLLVEVPPAAAPAFEAHFAGPLARCVAHIGTVTDDDTLSIAVSSKTELSLSVERLLDAWSHPRW